MDDRLRRYMYFSNLTHQWKRILDYLFGWDLYFSPPPAFHHLRSCFTLSSDWLPRKNGEHWGDVY